MPTLLCVPIMVEDEPTALRDAAEARDAGADIVEYRIDSFFTGSRSADGSLDEREVRAILRMVRDCPLPCIVTCRAASEAGGGGESGGGGYDGDDAARVALYEKLGTAGDEDSGRGRPDWLAPRYIDVEHSTYSRSANIRQKIDLAVDHPGQRRLVSTGLILSFHDFAGRPPDLLRRLAAIAHEPAARIAKIAMTARSVRDNLELFDLLADNAAGKPMIALAMGRFGLMSRVLAPKFGGFLTFAALRPGAGTAPGQPTVRDLLELYRFRAINRQTRVLGVIGWPVDQSMSPVVHNAGLEAYRADSWDVADHDPCNAVYLPLPVGPEYEHFKATIDALVEHPRLDFAGCSVTVPHKQHLVRFARERIAAGDTRWTIDAVSTLAGAANTLIVERTGEAAGYTAARVENTDAPAAAGCLAQALETLVGRTIVLIGAGGVARAIAAGLLAEDARVVVMNRTRESADQMVAELRSRLSDDAARQRLSAADIADLARINPDAAVNCTPQGMTGGPAPRACAIDPNLLRAWSAAHRARPDRGEVEPVVFDTVYNPLRTPLLGAADELGLTLIDGLGMFVAQAGMQFTAWTGRPAPLRLFDRICRDALGG
ncbi:MAG: type I 3-dehydroquinate dehydratase [Phycisphaeraceae bacterium]|nr:type I 3-dehydroquinate dehydratase [Phycisphaeraceae bacterium]